MHEDVEALKAQYIPTIADVETLRMMLEEHPKDELIAKTLATALAKQPADKEYRTQLEALISQYRLERRPLYPKHPKPSIKTYTPYRCSCPL